MMKTCPRCGAENLQTASSCRLCAVPLEAPESLLGVRADVPEIDRLPPTVSTSGADPVEQPKPSPYSTHTVCSACNAINEQTWLYCQQCGQKLSHEKEKARAGGSTESRETVTDLDPPPVESAPVSCGSCGALQARESLYCTLCGGSLTGAVPVTRGQGRRESDSPYFLELVTDGRNENEVYPLDKKELVLGRVEGDVTFSHDGYMSGRHARVVERDGRFFLVDENSRNGTFIRIDQEVELKPGDTFLVGKQLLRFDKKN
jgi:ribosomal protein L40E